MKSTKLVTSVAALSLMLAGAAFAQSYTLNGSAVPEDQVARIQAHCDMLMSGQDASGGGNAATGDSASGSAAGTTGNGSLTDTSNEAGSSGNTSGTASAGTGTDTNVNADTGVGTDTDATAGVGVDAAAGVDASASASTSATVDFTTLDVATIDLAACQAGGFGDTAGMGNVGASTDASGTTSTTTSQ